MRVFLDDDFAPSDARYLPGEFRIKHAVEPWELAECARLRRDVFCEEQGIFDGNDRDAIDEHATPIAAIACVAGMPEQVVGTVRIHIDRDNCWYGSRLAVRDAYRGVAWIGRELIIHAVTTAHARGCTRFLAHVQQRNVRLFERLHWQTLQRIELHGRPHALMQADLNWYPPRIATEIMFVLARQRAA
jgi:putative N-acetyltransferase (TIGR04045 family)